MTTSPAPSALKQHPGGRESYWAEMTEFPELRESIACQVLRGEKTFRRHPEMTA